MKKYNIGASVIFIALGIIIIWNSDKLQTVDAEGIGSDIWPKILAGLLILLSVLLLIKTIIKKSNLDSPFDFKSYGMKRVGMLIIALAVFALLLHYLGFMIAAMVLIPSCTYIMGEKRYKIILMITLGILAAIYVIFTLILGLPLPQGKLL